MKECTFDSEVSSKIVEDQSVTHLDSVSGQSNNNKMFYHLNIKRKLNVLYPSISDIDFINMKILSPINKLNENVNISSALWSTSRILYPKLARKCKTDMLLPRRMQLKLAEERSLMTKNTTPAKPVPEVNIN